MTLRTKTSLLLGIFITVVFAVAGILSLRFLEDVLRKSIYTGLEGVSSASSEVISRFLDETLQDSQMIAVMLPPKALEEKNGPIIEEQLKSMMQAHPKFRNGFFLLNPEGELWVDYPPHPEVRGRSFAFREYFKRTMQEQKGVVSIPYRSARTNEPVLTFTALLRGSRNQILGLIGCSVQLLHPRTLGDVRNTKIGESGYIYVYDTSRLMILHPEDQRVLQRDVAPGANKLFDAAIGGFEGVGETVNSKNIPMLLSVKKIQGTDWILGAQQPKSEAFAPIRKARNGMIWGTAFAVLAAILTGAFVFQRLTDPLVKLRGIAIQMGKDSETIGDVPQEEKGDLQKELRTIQSADEIGDLANAFGLMNQQLSKTFVSLKETIKTLRESEERYRTLAEAAQDMIFIVDRNGLIQYANEVGAKQFGSSSREIIGKSQESLFPPEVSARHKVNIQKIFETGRPFYVENSTPFQDRVIHLGTWLAPIRGESGEVEAVLGISRNITDRKQMEEALQKSEKKYRSLVDNANDAIFIVQDGIIKFPNPSTLRLSGYAEKDYTNSSFLTLIHPDDREMVLERNRKRIQGEDVPNNYSFRIFNKAGAELWVQLNGVLIDWEGRPAVLCFLRDITPQKRLEAQILQAQKMEAVGILAGGIAHDFNNLLQTILGYTEILLMEDPSQSIPHQELSQIKHAAKRGAELTQQLLTFSRKVQSKLRPVNLNQEVRQVEKLLTRTIPKMIEVELDLEEALKTIHADPAQVEQILMNLAVNSRDAMPEGGKIIIQTKNITLDRLFCRDHLGAKPGQHVGLTVSDTGQGMDEETLGHIFDPFFTTKGVGKGTGLGLAMVYGIIKSHGGYIHCVSQKKKGTTFHIYFPVAEQVMVEEKRTGEENEPRGGRETILLVEDEEPILNFGEKFLKTYGYTVLKAANGEDCLDVYNGRKDIIDLIILDLIMPGMGGQKCLEELLKVNPKVKVVIASGYSAEGVPKNLVEAGAKAFINKPYDVNQIFRVIREVLDGNH